jgi:phage/plasmid primase-like uncharacterized protein
MTLATFSECSRVSEAQISAALSGASMIALATGGGVLIDDRKSRASAGDYWAVCPFHQERTASLHIVDRGAQSFFKCFGCGEKGDAIVFACKLYGCGFREAVEIIGGRLDAEPNPELVAARDQLRREREAEAEQARVSRRAASVAVYFAAGVHVAGTLGEGYLRKARAIRAPLGGAELRFHSRAPLSPYDHAKAGRCPAIVAAIRDADGEHIGSHLTFLAHDGSAKRCFEHLSGDARMICGDHVGGFIRLGLVRDAAVIGEGIETTLSASEACGVPGLAAINAPNLRAVVLPATVRRVLIAFDRDPKGVGEMSAEALAQRLWADGVAVEMLPPPEGFKDWNDAAKAGFVAKREAAHG